MTGAVESVKPLNVGYKKLCECPTSHINCMNAKEWIQGQVAVWEFFYEKRDIRDKNVHPAVYPIALAKKCIQLFTHQGELVIDPFVGSGTTLIAAMDTNRNCVGFDLRREYVDLSNERVSQSKIDNAAGSLSPTIQIAVHADSHEISEYLRPESVTLSVTSPPYANILNRPRLNKSLRGNLRKNEHFLKVQQYSSDPRDLGTMEPIKYAESLARIFEGLYASLKPKAHCVINVTDIWWKDQSYGHREPVHKYVIDAIDAVGYDLRNIIIWDRRKLVNKVGIFGWPSNYITLGTTFEYILDFWKPP